MLSYAEQFKFQCIINEIAFYKLWFASAQRYSFLSLEKDEELEMASLLYYVLCNLIQIQS